MNEDTLNQMKQILSRIAYPSRGTADESADILSFAAEIAAKWSVSDLESCETELPVEDA